MHYFKNVELTKMYPVSEKAVRNWVDGAVKGKLNLQLVASGEKQYIADSAQNRRLLEQLVERGKKYKNTRALKIVSPKPEFYELYNKEQIHDIISHLEVRREIPLKYTYFNGGAHFADEYIRRLEKEDEYNSLRSTIELLGSNFANIDRFIGDAKRVNVVDLGAGNGRPVKELLEHLSKTGVLNRYIAIDISEEMLNIAEGNIKKWLGDKFKVEKHLRDFEYDRFRDLLVNDYLNSEEKTVNLVLLIGGTLSNAHSPEDTLRTINNSMGPNDFFLHSMRVDTPGMRRNFDFSASHQTQPLGPALRLILENLGIDESLYEVVHEFDEEQHMRVTKVKLKTATSIKFELNQVHSVEFNKGDSLLMWRARHITTKNVIDRFSDAGFELLDASLTSDHGYFLSISDLKTNRS